MNQIAIITDSTCGLSHELIQRHNLIITPCHLEFGRKMDEIEEWVQGTKTINRA